MTEHFLGLSGYQSSDPRVTRIASLAAHKFVADVTNDAMRICKARQQAKGGRLVLTTDDLAQSAHDYGITIRKVRAAPPPPPTRAGCRRCRRAPELTALARVPLPRLATHTQPTLCPPRSPRTLPTKRPRPPTSASSVVEIEPEKRRVVVTCDCSPRYSRYYCY